ncbi:MAG: putative pre-16S rRNA nuclease [Gammaproteobacteria bacterium]|nr:putative pre-16S rRNA nuclease [Gammaproteobacteria bacterium]
MSRGVQPPLTLMAFDYGERRIGVAVGQTITRSASPLAIIAVHDGRPEWEELSRLVEQYAPERMIVGLPSHADEAPHPMAARIARFCNQLRERYRLPVQTINERLSSHEARARADTDGQAIDALAAQVILETWLNENRPA